MTTFPPASIPSVPVDRRRAVITMLLLVVALFARLLPGERVIDDAYITFRYARNLLDGQGFVYNPGERVLGTTTPLYTLLLAGLGELNGGAQAPFPELALGVNAVADVVTCLLLWQIGRRLKAEWAGFAAGLIWAVAPYSVTFAIGGLETSVYIMLLTAAVAAYLYQNRPWAALFAGLALLTRPDALILVVPLAIDRLWQVVQPGNRRQLLTLPEVANFFLPNLAWYGFAWSYFGSPFPQSVLAKMAAYHLQPGEALIRLVQHYATPFLQQNILGTLPGVALGLILFPFLYLVGARRAWRVVPRSLPWLLYPWLYLLVFALANPLIFRWYLSPPLPAYFLFILIGAEQVIESLLAWKKSRPEPPHERIESGGAQPPPAFPAGRAWLPAALTPAMLAGVILLLPLVSTLSEWRLHPDHGPDRIAPQMAYIKLELLYQEAASFLAPQITLARSLAGPATLIAAGDVGVLGYQTGARILDTVGLNTPVSTRYYPLPAQAYEINYAIPVDLLLDQQPDFIVILEVYGRRTLVEDDRFRAAYEVIHILPTDIYGSRDLLIYARRPPPK